MTMQSNQPSHLVYHVEAGEGEDSGYWTKLGAMWPHKDGKGWSMRLSFLPVGGDGTLTIRLNEPKDAGRAS